jgi:hypothetical protein
MPFFLAYCGGDVGFVTFRSIDRNDCAVVIIDAFWFQYKTYLDLRC